MTRAQGGGGGRMARESTARVTRMVCSLRMGIAGEHAFDLGTGIEPQPVCIWCCMHDGRQMPVVTLYAQATSCVRAWHGQQCCQLSTGKFASMETEPLSGRLPSHVQ